MSGTEARPLPRCVLHLGAHKTGTSLIQKYLRDKPDSHGRLGIAYISRSATNDLIGWGERVEADPSALRVAIAEAAESPDRTVVVSHENSLGKPLVPTTPGLYPDCRRYATALASATESMDTTVVYYIREQAAFLESYYLQTIHQGGYNTFRQWLKLVDIDACSWEPVVENIRATFGREKVVIKDFAEIDNGQDAFITSFLSVFSDASAVTVNYSPRRNPSVSDIGLRIALDVNPLLESADERRAMRKYLQQHYNNATGDRPMLFTEEEKVTIATKFSASNAGLLDSV